MIALQLPVVDFEEEEKIIGIEVVFRRFTVDEFSSLKTSSRAKNVGNGVRNHFSNSETWISKLGQTCPLKRVGSRFREEHETRASFGKSSPTLCLSCPKGTRVSFCC